MLFAPEFRDTARLSGENSPDGRQGLAKMDVAMTAVATALIPYGRCHRGVGEGLWGQSPNIEIGQARSDLETYQRGIELSVCIFL